jgi:hypothetical protein
MIDMIIYIYIKEKIIYFKENKKKLGKKFLWQWGVVTSHLPDPQP